MNCIIIEDEINSRILLQEVLTMYFPHVRLLGVGSSVSEGITLINKLKPDVVLLDIEIVGGTGFDILDAVDPGITRIIFITGYEHYALKAIKYAALDYLVKPLSVEELRLALKKAGPEHTENGEQLRVLKEALSKEKPESVMIPSGKGYTVVAVSSICYFEANGQYVYVHLEDRKKILASHSLGYYEELLSPAGFFRTHKSYMVNVRKVKRIVMQPSLQLELSNQLLVDLAVRRKEAFMELFKQQGQLY